MPRAMSTTFKAALEDPHSDDPPMVFLTLSHADLADDIRLVWDEVNYELGGETYIGFPFEIQLLSDDEEAPRGRITIANVDRRIGEAVRALRTPPDVVIEIYHAADFDLTVDPRVPLGTPALQYRASNLFFRRVQISVMSASGELASWDYANLPWPSRFATEALLPGLFV